MSQAKDLNASIVRFDLPRLQSIACDRIPVCRKRVAEAYLRHHYGEREIPSSEYLDKVFGIDCVIHYRGWTLGLDITLDPDAVPSKQQKQQSLISAYRALGIDKAGVIVADGTPLKDQLSAIIRS